MQYGENYSLLIAMNYFKNATCNNAVLPVRNSGGFYQFIRLIRSKQSNSFKVVLPVYDA
jgi:hypothetical protein